MRLMRATWRSLSSRGSKVLSSPLGLVSFIYTPENLLSFSRLDAGRQAGRLITMAVPITSKRDNLNDDIRLRCRVVSRLAKVCEATGVNRAVLGRGYSCKRI